MNPTLIGIIGIIIMVLLFLTRMPVAYVMGIIGFLGFSIIVSFKGGLNLLAKSYYETFSSYGLTTVPLFILMGQLAFNSGISRRLYDTAYKYLGNIRGGLAITTVSACTAFGAVCGSSAATAATMATVGLPEMRRKKYADELAAGSVASGGGLGMIMPPSVVLIVYGVLTEQSIGKLFVAGIFPALLVTILFIITILIWCSFAPEQGPTGETFPWKEKFKSLLDLSETLAVFALVMGGLFVGLFTPTEAAAVGVFGVIAVSLIRRQLTWEKFVSALYETLGTSCMVMMLIAGAEVFGKFLAVTRIPFNIASWIGGFDLPAFLVLGMVVIVYFMGGCFMDSLALVMLTVPIFFPLVLDLGYDPIWFGIIIVMVTEMGVITPPVGINVYVVFGVARGLPGGSMALESIFKGIFPFMLATLVGIIILFIFPQIILYLPNLMY
ncbi:C4-dicarboxylate TRAP transporter large permease protein [Desulfonema limicola]|uniref:C4-dicarboxylate TRAP transporter large permease protein n=1 Tax=Desulfonema limicola TaxID=45656 RepID=A0A975B740_9BACT|nr:TRAP transporter large permease [Desulfonema limicola]QTA80089.1 C4-dicarboxylate TRAP transporter large permease protein [Desulfonema limicola]